MADLAALGRTDAARLAVGLGRHVVVVHVALVCGPMVSSIWFMRGMASVTTFSTWVSPRWNRPEPWAVGSTPTSADTGRRSVGPRPSMRTPSFTMRARTSFLVSDADGLLDLLVRPANSPSSPASVASELGGDLVDGGVALGLGGDRDGVGEQRPWRARDTRSTRRRCSRPGARRAGLVHAGLGSTSSRCRLDGLA